MYCLYASPLTLLLLAVVDCSVKREFKKDASLIDKVCPVDKQVFTKKAVSPIFCLAIASTSDGCNGVGYNEEQNMCYGCSTSTDDNGEFQSLPGTVFYSPPKAVMPTPPVPTTADACPGVFQNISGYMLMVVNEQTWTYDEANNTCAVCSASLVRIDSPEKQTAIQAHLNTLAGSKYWIQCRNDTSDGMWKFDDGTAVPMTNDYWYPSYPLLQTIDCDCGNMCRSCDYRWINTYCHEQSGFICEIK